MENLDKVTVIGIAGGTGSGKIRRGSSCNDIKRTERYTGLISWLWCHWIPITMIPRR